jgi:hypothetical protein
MRSGILVASRVIVVAALVAVPAASARAQHEQHKPNSDSGCCCRMSGTEGQNPGAQAAGQGCPMMGRDAMRNMMQGDMADLHFLLEHRSEIRRTVTNQPDGVETLTESDVPDVAERLKIHVAAMYSRLESGRPIHQRDPLFREVFAHASQIHVTITPTAKGLRVVETSPEPSVAKLVQAHAEVVNLFLRNGMSEMTKDHPVP